MVLFCFVFQIYSSMNWTEATSPPSPFSHPHPAFTEFPEGKLRPQPGSDVINCLASYLPIKCITLIKSIKEVNKREAGEKWCYWSEVLHKWLSPGVSVNRHAGHSRGRQSSTSSVTSSTFASWRCSSILFQRWVRLEARNQLTSHLHNALD